MALPGSTALVAPPGPTVIGVVRTHGDGDAVETVRNATVPWRPLDPGRAAIDLTAWDALPPP